MSKIKDPAMRVLSKDFQQPDGYPDTPTVNKRTMDAVARLQVRGVTPQPNPLITTWQLHALIRVLVGKGLLDQKDVDDITYFTAYIQMNDLERLVDQKPPSPLLVPKSTVGLIDGN